MNNITCILGIILLGVTPDWAYTVIAVIMISWWCIVACIPYFIFKKNKSEKLWVDILGGLTCLYVIYYIFNSSFLHEFGLMTPVICSLPFVLLLIIYTIIRINNYRDRNYKEEQDFFKNL